MTALSELRPGEWGRVVGFHTGDSAYRHKLLAMGLVPHATFQVVRRAPLGDPIQLRLPTTHALSLRQAEAAVLKIERVDHG